MRIDLNCDLGEGAGHDEELMPLITSANIACGAHAGDRATMRQMMELAARHGVAIGAHPGFADREHFGRRELAITELELRTMLAEQFESFRQVARETKRTVSHVKYHGALYNLAARDPAIAKVVVEALFQLEPRPVLMAPAGSVLERVAREHGDVRVVAEGFADRTYRADGTLTSRARPDALITDEAVAVAQVLRMVREGVVRSIDGPEVPMRVETICLHGDGQHAVAFARRLRRELAGAEIRVAPFSA